MKLSTFLAVAALSVSSFLGAATDGASTVDASARLCAFAGNYISYGHSIGWTPNFTIPNASFAATRSQANVSQLTIDRYGSGVFNFISYTIHNTTNPLGITFSTNITPALTGLPFTVDLTDSSTGSGTVTFPNFPSPGAVITFDFVSKGCSGKIEKIWLNATNVPGTTVFPSNNASFVLAERQ